MNSSTTVNQKARDQLASWQHACRAHTLKNNSAFCHSMVMHGYDEATLAELEAFSSDVQQHLMPLVIQNNHRFHWPSLSHYDGIGNVIDSVTHHPTYDAAGDIIYGTGMLSCFSRMGDMLKSFFWLYLSGHAGEAGHNCPAACSAGIIRVLNQYPNTRNAAEYLEKLIIPNYRLNYTGAQFLTEIQGGSDVGANAVSATQVAGDEWTITGEKWFCSNANADLMLVTARHDSTIKGTKGLALFLVPARLDDGSRNSFRLRRLKEKIGTCSMASAEIDFVGATGYLVGDVDSGFQIVMEHVLHVSRFFNTFVMLGMVHQAYMIARHYASYRQAFGQPIIEFPLVGEQLADIKCQHYAIQAGAFHAVAMQDETDLSQDDDNEKRLLLRGLANICKYISALWGVQHIHHCIDVLGGNGAIESFSILPRLLRDSIVCENWEGTHHTLRQQMLRDSLKYDLDVLILAHLDGLLHSLTTNKHHAVLMARLEHTRTMCMTLKQSKPALQSIMIKGVFDALSTLYITVCLLVEADHQEKTTNSTEKTACVDYLITHQGEGEQRHYDDDFLKRLASVLSHF